MAMALPLGKLTILVGAGIVGSVLAKEGHIPSVSDFFSGAFKIAFKQLKKDDTTPSSAKPRNDSLLAQVNSLRQELQLLASSRPVTIVTSSDSGGSKYGIIVVVVVVGYGYVWWKGWKLPDMMFASRRSLSDACTSIAKQLETVYSSISVAKRHLSSRIDKVDRSLDECAELTSSTREEVSELKGETTLIGVDVQSVHHAVQTLETKINRIQGNQAVTIEGVKKLVALTMDNIQVVPSSSSRPAIELPPMSPSSRAESLPSVSLLELPSPSASNGSHKVKRPLQNAVSDSGLKELHGVLDAEPMSSPRVSNEVDAIEDQNEGNSSSGRFGHRFSGFGAAFITRTCSVAMKSFK
ncbi:hypothetical protein LguiA_000054 [Lonicera macranthoides]